MGGIETTLTKLTRVSFGASQLFCYTTPMTELVLYRKYRPQTFKEILGQGHIVGVLEGSIREGNIAHAYLFAGSRGTGKTSLARILARALGVSINDLHEIDAASNRGIDDIRELREAVNTLPFESPYKVYIVDEAHMLTKDAFNALLKTLEEPPSHVIFILATTEAHKLPETIVSRCQTYTFRKPSQKILKEMVVSVAKKEGFTLDPSAADLIALLADGSFRDAHGVLQKIIFSSSDKKVSAEEVEKVTGAPQAILVNNTIEAIDSGDIGKSLLKVKEALGSGVDAKIFLTLLLHKIRFILLLRFAKELESYIKDQFTSEDFLFLEKISGNKNSHVNATLLQELLDAYTHIGLSRIPQLPIELALIKMLASSE